ncbi:RabGAP TBC, partial [Rhizoctonia solani]
MSGRVTRSATRLRSIATESPATDPVEPATLPRRKKPTASGRSGSPTPSKRPAPTLRKVSGSAVELPTLPPFIEPPYDPALIPAVLTFSFDKAKEHLIRADGRFEKIFKELPCRPFEHLEPVDPFHDRGQQISWLAAKSIRHRFLRLFDRSLPEKVSLNHDQGLKYTFPSPGRIASVDEGILRTAGLSGRKAEYGMDNHGLVYLARFADGRLSTQKLANTTDEELLEMLIAVRGIGKWTVDMFAIFSLRRPDILPVGDLGTQKGLLNWVLSSHDPEKHSLCIDPKKLPKTDDDEPEKPKEAKAVEPGEDTSVLPTPVQASTSKSTAAAPEVPNPKQFATIPLVPVTPVPLPEGVTLEMLKARANGKKAKGGCYLLPNEMEALTASWKPYRSLASSVASSLVPITTRARETLVAYQILTGHSFVLKYSQDMESAVAVEPITTGNKTMESEPTVASPRSSSSSVVHALNTSKSTTTSTTSVDTPRDGDSPRPSTTPKETDTIKDTEDEFQELSLDDTEAADPRFSTVPLYTPSVKSRPLDSPEQSKPGSPTGRRRSTSVTSPIPAVAALKQSRRKTIASGSSAGNLPLLLARLEQKSAKEEADPSLKRASVDGASKLVDGFKKIHDDSEGDTAGAVDWGFWGEVVANYEEVARTRPTELAQAIENGIPASLRGMMWQLMSASKDAALEKIYSDLIKKPTPHEKAIMRDLGRTFPNHEFFTDGSGVGQENLFNVLKAYSLYDPDVGYCQGLAFIVAALLLNMPDEEAFCVLCRLMHSYDLRGHFLPDMPGLQLRLYQFDRLVEDVLPVLHIHFVRQGIKSSMYCSQWFLTMFSYRLPLDLVFRIMDTVFANGIEAIFGFSLVLLYNNEEAILKLKFDQILEYLKGPLFDSYKIPESERSSTSSSALEYRADDFVQDAFKISRTFTPFMLDSYAGEYQAKVKAENAHQEEMDALRAINRNLSQHVKQLEASLAQINTEHCALVKQLVMSKLEQEELEGELVKFKILYAELMHQKEDDNHRASIQSMKAARASATK